MADARYDADVLGIALTLACRHEVPVFPCGANKRPAIAEDQGGHGFLDATTDPAAIRALFAKAPHTKLIGMPTGPRSGIDALDIDPRHGGDAWERQNLHRPPETRIHQTGGGGRHRLFRHAHGVARNSAGRIAPGIDIRGDGGYIIWWPAHGCDVISDVPIAHWPDWLLQPGLVLPLKPPPAMPCHVPVSRDRVIQFARRALDRLRGAADGSVHYTLRNTALLLGGVLHHGAFTFEDAVHWLLDAVPSAIRDWRNEEATIRWGLQHGQAMPIELPPSGPGWQDAPHERLWREAQPLLGSLGAGYLQTIGLGHLTSCAELRFHPACPHPTGGRLPALIAAVRALDGALTGVQRVYLRADGLGLANVEPLRAALGAVMGGAIRLASLEDAVAAGELVIAEDVEEAASLGRLLYRPAWAAATPANLAAGIVLPPEIKRVAIATVGTNGAPLSAWYRLRREGRAVKTATPNNGAATFNEVVKRKKISGAFA
jgi:hypothetical protein